MVLFNKIMNPMIVCVYKSGGDFTSKYVNALKTSLDKYFPTEFDFWCFTDRPEEINGFVDNCILLKHDLPGWWSKIELFKEVYPYNSRVMYFDLDVLILKDLTDFYEAVVKHPAPLMLRSSDPVGKSYDWPSSSIISWTGNDLHAIYEAFMDNENVILEAGNNVRRAGQQTDQGFIRLIINPDKFQDFLPEDYIVFKNEYFQNPKLFESAYILNWTGKPRYPQMGENLQHIKNIWEGKEQEVIL